MPDDKPVIVKPTLEQVKRLGNKSDLVPLTSGDKKPRGWYIYTKQAVCIANSRGVAKGITEPREKKPTGVRVTGYVITDPHFVDYDPPKEPYTIEPRVRRNPFEFKGPEFIESSYVEEPAYACDPDVRNRRNL